MRSTKWRLSTRAGRAVEAISFRLLALCMVLVVFACALYFLYATPSGHGLGDHASTTATECLYFSVVTFSSLGYGDLHPAGFGRLVAVFEVMFGLVLVALLVGKLASERQSGLIRLLYTSDHQRRLAGFAENLSSIEGEIREALRDYDHIRLAALGDRLNRFLGGIRQYLRFQSHEGALLEFGNTGALRELYERIFTVVEAASNASKTRMLLQDSKASLDKAIRRAEDISNDMVKLEHDEKSLARFRQIQYLAARHAKYQVRSNEDPGTVAPKDVTEITENLLDRVRLLLPKTGVWPKDIHKSIAQRLSLPARHVQRCIDELIKRGDYGSEDNQETEGVPNTCVQDKLAGSGS